MQIKFANREVRDLFFITLFFTVLSILILIVGSWVASSSLLPESADFLLAIVLLSNGYFALFGLISMGVLWLFGSVRFGSYESVDQDEKTKAG